MLEERFRLIKELKESDVLSKIDVSLIGYQRNSKGASMLEQIRLKIENKLTLTPEEKQIWEHQQRYEQKKQTYALDEAELERVGALLEREESDSESEHGSEPVAPTVVEEPQVSAEEKPPETLSYLLHPELEEWVEERWESFPEVRYPSGPGLSLPSVSLPIQELREDLRHFLQQSDTVAIQTSTGTGKSTQVPKYLLEMSYGVSRPFFKGRILVTEPRRIAASGCCKRVQEEVGSEHTARIGFAVRGASENPQACVCYVTEGVLLQMLQADFMLKDITAVVLDEVHERSQAMDVLVGTLVVLQRHRRRQFDSQLGELLQQNPEATLEELEKKITVTPLKLLLMSATLDQQEILGSTDLFPRRPPVLELPKKIFPVAIHMEPKQRPDYVQAAVDKVIWIHQTAGAGSILVFLTGQAEIKECIKLLKEAFATGADKKTGMEDPQGGEEDVGDGADEVLNNAVGETQQAPAGETDDKEEEYDQEKLHTFQGTGHISPEQIAQLRAEYDAMYNPKEEEVLEEEKGNTKRQYTPIILPLHGQLTLEDQKKIFDPLEENCRLIIVATNVAESSLTIPAVKYVVDACRHKVKIALQTGCRLSVQLASQANLTQRSGRAGRVCPGHCFRLLTPGQITHLEEQPQPEMSRLPLEGVVLQLLSMGVQNPERFPFPTHPGPQRIRRAMETLYGANCIIKHRPTGQVRLTEFGLEVQKIPLDFRQSLILALGLETEAALEAALLAASLSVENLLVFGNVQLPVCTPRGDLIDLLFSAGAVLYNTDRRKMAEFCTRNNLRLPAWEEVSKLFGQLVQKLKVPGILGRPSASKVQIISKIVVQSGLEKIAFLQEEDRKYGIAPVNVLEFLKEDELDEEIIKNNLLDVARVSKASSVLRAAKSPECVSYFKLNVALLETTVAGEIVRKPAAFLQDCHPFSKALLLEFVDFSPFITTQDQQAPRWDPNLGLRCEATCYYEDLHRRVLLGKAETAFPGRTFEERNTQATVAIEKAKALVVCLLKGQVFPELKQFVGKLTHSIRTATEQKAARLGKKLQQIDDIAQFFLQKQAEDPKSIALAARQNPAQFKRIFEQCYQHSEEPWQALLGGLARAK